MGEGPSPATGSLTQSGIERMLGRLQAMAEENGDRALESSIVTAQRAVACWQELSQRVAYHEHARDLASSLERHARERLHLILDLVTRFADLPSTPGRRLDAAAPGPDPAPGPSWNARTGDRSGDPGAAPEIAVCLLGGFELRVNGRRVDQWRGRRGQALLQFLVAHRRRAVSREALIEALWPEADEDAGRRRLHQAVYALRQTLRDAGASYRHIVCANGFYQLDPAVPIWTDVDELDRLVEEARRLEAERQPGLAFETYRKAERLYRGNFLEDVPFAEWATAERSRLWRAMSSSPTVWPTCTPNGATMRPLSRSATGCLPATPGTRSARAARCARTPRHREPVSSPSGRSSPARRARPGAGDGAVDGDQGPVRGDPGRRAPRSSSGGLVVHVGGEHRDVDVLAGPEDEFDLAAAVLGAGSLPPRGHRLARRPVPGMADAVHATLPHRPRTAGERSPPFGGFSPPSSAARARSARARTRFMIMVPGIAARRRAAGPQR